jgi:hypothetical protein
MSRNTRTPPHYRITESKYKGGAREMYVTYDLAQKTHGGQTAVYPKVKRVYIAGDVKDWSVGDFRKKSGRTAHGVRIQYQQTRRGYRRQGFTAHRGRAEYDVQPASIASTAQNFTQIVDVPQRARNVRLYEDRLPSTYRSALQRVR